MDDYRSLTEEEISTLESQGCQAEDWTAINVAENFSTEYLREVKFYGEVNLGVFEKNITVDEGFSKHSGIYSAVLKDVTLGDNCLIERTGNYINNYDIGEECYISNIGKMNTTSDATFGEGNVISVRNESGDGNVILFDSLNTQIAAFQIRHADAGLHLGDGSLLRFQKEIVGGPLLRGRFPGADGPAYIGAVAVDDRVDVDHD